MRDSEGTGEVSSSAIPRPGTAAITVEPAPSTQWGRQVAARLPPGMLLWFLVVVFALTWTPIGDGGARLQLVPPSGARVIVGNLLLVGPVAIIVAMTARHLLDGKRSLRLGTLAAALVSATAELGQIFVDGRTVSIYDLALNTSGGAVAAWAALSLLRRGIRPGVILGLTGAAVLAGVLVLLVRATNELRIEGWDPSFEVVAGEEVGGFSPYLGTVFDPLICVGSAPSERCAAPGADEVLTRDLALRAERSRRVRLSARVLSLSAQQEGPARIVSFSASSVLRNATLAQSGDTLILRVRTPRTGLNGYSLEFVLPGAVGVGVETAVDASYSPGRIRLRAEDTHGVRSATFPTGVLAAWWFARPAPQRQLLPGEGVRARLVGALVLLLPVGLATAWIPGVGPALASVFAPVLALGALSLLELSLGTALGLEEAALALLLGLAGSLLGRSDRGPFARPVSGKG